MQKHTAHHHRATVHHHHRVLRHPAKRIALRKETAEKEAASKISVVPKPELEVIEVMELDFVDPDIIPYEEAAMTSFDDEDL